MSVYHPVLSFQQVLFYALPVYMQVPDLPTAIIRAARMTALSSLPIPTYITGILAGICANAFGVDARDGVLIACVIESRVSPLQRCSHRNPDHRLCCMRCHNSRKVSREPCNGDEDFDTIIGDSLIISRILARPVCRCYSERYIRYRTYQTFLMLSLLHHCLICFQVLSLRQSCYKNI